MKSKLPYLLLALGLAGLVATGCSKESKKAGHLKRAETFFTKGDYDRAEIEYKNVLRLDPTNRAAIRNLGLMSFDQGRTIPAYLLLIRAKTNDPGDLEVSWRLANVRLAGGEPKEARQEAVLMLARQPTNEQALLLLADSSVSTNDIRDAQQRLAGLKPLSGNLAGYHLAAGILLVRKGDVTNAEVAFRQALTVDPKSSAAHAAIGNLCLLRFDRTNAEAAFRAAAENAPPRSGHRLRYAEFKVAVGEVPEAKRMLEEISKQTPDYLPALLKLAQIALAERRFQDCEGLLRSVQTRDPSHLEGMLLMAQMQLARGEPAKAITELERALKIYPKLAQIHYQLALAGLMQNDLPGAIKRLNTAVGLQPDFPEAVLMLAELNIRRNDATAAINALNKLLAQRPQLIRAQLLLATAFRVRARSATSLDLDEALRIYQNLSRTYPTNPEPALLSGAVFEQQRKPAEARKCFERVLSFAPDNLAALEQLIEMDLSEQKFAAARARAQQQIDRNPKLAAPQVLLARAYLAETNFTAAESALQKAIEAEPDFRPAHALLARVYVSANKYPEALRKLNELVARNTNDVLSLQQLAELHSAATNYVAAREAYEKILVVNPKFTTALNNLAWLYSEHLGDPKRAYELASRAHELAPTNAYTSDTFGWVLYRNRDYPRALGYIQASAAELPGQPEVQYHLGMTHYMMGEEAAATVALQNAVQLAKQADWLAEARSRLRILEIDPQVADAKIVAELKALLERSPDDPVLLCRLAAISERDGKWQEAAASYEQAIAANERLVPAMIKLAQLCAVRLNDPARALTLARRARNLEPDDPVIAGNLGKLALASARATADFQWAFGLLQESVQKLPNDPDVRFNFAQACFQLGRTDDAAAAMQVAIKAGLSPTRRVEAESFLKMHSLARDADLAVANAGEVEALLKRQPDSLPGLVVHGVIQERKGNYTAARDSYEQVLKLAPAFAPANKALAVVYFTHLKDPQKAYDYAVKSREAFPRDLQVARTLGLLTYQRSDFSRAAGLLTECIATYPEDSEVRYCLGLSQYKLKQTRECKANLTKALTLAPNSSLAAEAKRLLAEIK